MRIVLDGLDMGRTAPAVIEVPRGRHVLQLFKPGHEVYVLDPFEVQGSATLVVEAQLVKILYPVSISLGSMGRETSLKLNGVPIAFTPVDDSGFATFSAPMGQHRLTCTSERGSASTDFEVVDNLRTTLSCDPEGATSPVAGWSLVIGGSTLFAAGTALLVWYAVDVDFAERNDLVIVEESIPHREIIGPSLMGVGAALGLLSLVFLLDSDDDAVVQPTFSPRGDGALLGLTGRF